MTYKELYLTQNIWKPSDILVLYFSNLRQSPILISAGQIFEKYSHCIVKWYSETEVELIRIYTLREG